MVPLCPESKANSRQMVVPKRKLDTMVKPLEEAIRDLMARQGPIGTADAKKLLAFVHANYTKEANGQRPVLALSYKGKKFLENCVMFLRSIKPPSPLITNRDKIALVVGVQYADYRRDVDVSLIEDALERAGIFPNDRQLRWKQQEAIDTTGTPVFQLTLVRIGELPWKSQAKRKTAEEDNF